MLKGKGEEVKKEKGEVSVGESREEKDGEKERYGS